MDNVFLQRQEGFAVCSSSRFFRRPSLNKDEKVRSFLLGQISIFFVDCLIIESLSCHRSSRVEP